MLEPQRLKVYFITNLCPPYRLPVYEELSRHYQLFFNFTDESNRLMDRSKFSSLQYSTGAVNFLYMLLRLDCEVLVINFPLGSAVLAFLAIKLRRKKIIFWVEEWHQPQTMARKLAMPLLRRLVKICDAVVVCGSAAKAHITSYGASPQKIFLAPNSSWIEVPKNVRPAVPDKEFIFLYLGRLVEYKGADYLIHAFSKLTIQKNAKLVIVGKGAFKNDLDRLIKDLDVKNVEIKEIKNDEDKYHNYANCNVFVLPSIWQSVYCEAWGLVLNEAMQCGKAIIATDAVGASFDLVKDGVNGFIVKNADSESLYQAMKRLVENPDMAKRMGEESKKIVNEQYTYEKTTKGFDDAIYSISL